MASIWEVSNAEYHKDRSKVGSTGLKTILKNPAEFRRLFVDEPPTAQEQSDALLLGSAFHCLVLEPDKFDSLFCVRPECDGRTTAGKEILSAFRLKSIGKTELKPDMAEQARRMAKAVLAEPLVRELMQGAIIERAIVWDESFYDNDTGLDNVVACKCKPDIFIERPEEASDLILDLKSADDPTPEVFGSGSSFAPIRKYSYSLQMAHYARGVTALTGKPCSVGLIACGKDEEPLVYVYDITPFFSVGMKHWNHAMQEVIAGRSTSVWRREDQGQVITLQPTNWDTE